jgi:hypothetical protein
MSAEACILAPNSTLIWGQSSVVVRFSAARGCTRIVLPFGFGALDRRMHRECPAGRGQSPSIPAGSGIPAPRIRSRPPGDETFILPHSRAPHADRLPAQIGPRFSLRVSVPAHTLRSPRRRAAVLQFAIERAEDGRPDGAIHHSRVPPGGRRFPRQPFEIP